MNLVALGVPDKILEEAVEEAMREAVPKRMLIAASFLQGLALLCLYRQFETESWLAFAPVLSWPLFAVATFLPLILLLTWCFERWQAGLFVAAAYTLLIAILAAFAGSQSLPVADARSINHGFAFSTSLWIMTFICTSLIQHQLYVGRSLVYEALFQFSWRNCLIPGFAALFTLITWLLLSLWGALFDLLEISIFSELFKQDWFLFPVLATVFGIGVIVFRDLTQVIDSATNLFRGLIKLLLPIATFISVIFLVALAARGPELVWQTGNGSQLMLWLIAINLFGCNAVYQDGQKLDVYPLLIHRLIGLGLLTLPFYVALSGYGLMLRVEQYGLSLARLYGLMVWLIAGLFVLGYCISVLRRRDAWVGGFAETNIRMALFIVALLALTHSPILDLKQLVIWHQIERLQSGKTKPEAFDVGYLYYELAAPGRNAVERLKQEYADDAAFLERLNNPRRRYDALPGGAKAITQPRLITRPADLRIPAALSNIIENRQFAGVRPDARYLIGVDLNDDAQLEYVYLGVMNNHVAWSELFYQGESDNWQARYLRLSIDARGDQDEWLESGEIKSVPPAFNDLEIGKLKFQVGSDPRDLLIAPRAFIAPRASIEPQAFD